MLEAADALLEMWHVDFYCLKRDRSIYSDLQSRVSIVEISWNKLFNILNIALKLRSYDYVLIWNPPMQFSFLISKIFFFCRAKWFWWHHHYPWYYDAYWKPKKWLINFIKSIFDKATASVCHKLIANSLYISESIDNIYWVDSPVLYPFSKYSTDLFSPDKQNVICAYWRWDTWKNLDKILDSFCLVKKEVPDCCLLIGWDAPIRDIDWVSFLWKLNPKQIIDILSKSKISLFASEIDSFWMVALESISSWIPVVALNYWGVSEIIDHKENWFLCNTTKSFIDRQIQLLTDDSLLSRMNKKCLDSSSKFSKDSFKEKLLNFFK